MDYTSASDLRRENPADAVEALWANSSDAPDLARLLSENAHWSPCELRMALLLDQQFRSGTTRPWQSEDYLELVPNLAKDEGFTLDLILGEVRGRGRQGHPPSLQELSGRFPHLQQQLERQLEIAAWFDDAGNRDFEADTEDSSIENCATGTRFGDYEIYEEIARGGMGVIYRARHRKLKRIVALKMIRPERLIRPAELRRFRKETRIIAQLDHPNIIDILNVDQVDGIHFFTMRMVEGRDLESRRAEYTHDVRLAARLTSSVAAAIDYAHQHGVLHRDLKPSNVLVDNSGVPFVVDFGLAGHLSEPSSLVTSDEFCGTPAYAAPELLHERSEPASVVADVYGLGAILYFLITGQSPFSGRNAQEVWNKIRNTPSLPPSKLNTRVDRDLEAICLKALDKNPASRYSSAAAFAKDLDRYLARETVAACPMTWWQHRLRKHSVGSALAAAALLIFAGLLAVIAIQSIELHEQKQQTDAIRQEADAYRDALQMSEMRAERLRADIAEGGSRPAHTP